MLLSTYVHIFTKQKISFSQKYKAFSFKSTINYCNLHYYALYHKLYTCPLYCVFINSILYLLNTYKSCSLQVRTKNSEKSICCGNIFQNIFLSEFVKNINSHMFFISSDEKYSEKYFRNKQKLFYQEISSV